MENNKDITYSKTYERWENGYKGNTPITANTLNQIETALKEVYDAVGSIHTIADSDPDKIIDLKNTIQKYKFSVQETIKNLAGEKRTTETVKDNANAIKLLNGSEETEGSVLYKIKNAIDTLDVDDDVVEKEFVTAVSETDGKISVTRKSLAVDDVPNLPIEKIDELMDHLTNLSERLSDVETFFKNDETASIVDEITTLKEIIDEFQKDNETEEQIQYDIKQLKEKPVVTYTTTDSDYETAEEFLIVCGNAQPYIIEEE